MALPWKALAGMSLGCAIAATSAYKVKIARAAPLPEQEEKVIIVGAGIGGLAAAVALQAQGFPVEVYEKAKALRPVGATLALSPNGLAALEFISPDVHERIVRNFVAPAKCRVLNMQDEIVRETPFLHNKARLLVWHLLQTYLACELDAESIHLDRSLRNYEVDPSTREVRALFVSADGKEEVVNGRCLIGADGVHSVVRKIMHNDEPQPVYHNKLMFRANLQKKKVLSSLAAAQEIPGEGMQFSWSRVPGELFSFRETGGHYLTFTAVAAYFPEELAASQEQLEPHKPVKRRKSLKRRDSRGGRKAILKRLFADYPPSVQNVIDITPEDAIFVNEVVDYPVCPRWVQGPIVLLGDSAHTLTPDAGQGANIALEDAAELAGFLAPAAGGGGGRGGGWAVLERGLALWEAQRLPRVRRVHQLSRELTAQHNPVNTPGLAEQPSQAYFDFIYQYKPSFKFGPDAAEGREE